MTGVLRVRSAADFDRTKMGLVARTATRVVLEPALLAHVAANRASVLTALDGDHAVYGVNTGMGALAGIRLDAESRARHQDTLMAGRAVGSAPWLRREQARAVLAVRLRTLLHPAAGVSPELCVRLADLLNADVVPAIPARGGGAAGEIIPLAHAGAVLIGTGQVLDAAGSAVDAGPVLAAAGLRPGSFGAKEGVAFLEGVPGLTGLALLATDEVRVLVGQVVAVAGAAQAVVGASADPLRPQLAFGDDDLGTVNAALLAARGDGPARALQAPVSFRVTGPALAVVVRAVAALEAAVERALTGVTDSPAHLDGRFYGTAGFAGTDLAAACAALTTALTHLAEIGAARLHRLLDPAVTGLPKQLSDAPGVHAGMVAVHKRAAGVAHRMRRFAMPALIGAMETSGGQEDVQSFGFEAAECLGETVDGLRDVLACELLAVHQAGLLSGAVAPILPAGVLPGGTADRPFGRDLDVLVELLRAGWASSVS
ncbi:histidine ammonia-lyase [Actinoplanes awajinensis subsp. mycoplanecinus]|uniref:Histidine ammonia-lyase n=2 Tax=Actinoplanes awajinensis TaxID=135946 RepID=A0A0X3UNZ8_9ACTN|nr:histidine ammonia-lyase [Actinoplanes awajinensis subsp. mycoplanecinus]